MSGVEWANGFIVNPTLMPSSVGCEEHAMQPTQLILDRCGVRDRDCESIYVLFS